MMKCDMCYDRTSAGLRPMCATVCPSQALAFGPADVIARQRAAAPTQRLPVRQRARAHQGVHDGAASAPVIAVDVEDYMWKRGPDGPEGWTRRRQPLWA